MVFFSLMLLMRLSRLRHAAIHDDLRYAAMPPLLLMMPRFADTIIYC